MSVVKTSAARWALAALCVGGAGCEGGEGAVDGAVAPVDGAADGGADAIADDAAVMDGGAADMGVDAAVDAVIPDAGADAAVPDAAVDAGPDAGPDAAPDAGSAATACASSYRAPQPTGEIEDPDLAEVSGIAPSATRAGVLWMHTDSGGAPRLYAVDTGGAVRGSVRLPVENVDFEDLAAADCPDGSGPCLWLADTGDNRRERGRGWVYAIPEPVVVGVDVAALWRFGVTYPGGPVDVEALAVAPDGQGFWLFEKLDGPVARVFASPGPLVDGSTVEVVEVAQLDAPGINIANGRSITGADLHPSGERLLIRVYTGSYEYRFGPGQGVADIGGIAPVTVAFGPLSEPQGEAIAYDADGLGVWTVSEVAGDAAQPINHYDCRD